MVKSLTTTASINIFLACDAAIANGVLIQRPYARDKEFAFQNWFAARLNEAGAAYEPSQRNAYPDFRLLALAEGYEVKGLETPGRDTTYDSNSAVPSGSHRERTIYYVFGRYPVTTEVRYPVVDFVICHGDFLNAQHDYVHENKSFRGFGSYGDIMIRDRKMYVPRTVYALAEGLAGRRTLIVPADITVDPELDSVGQLERIETDDLIKSYSFDLQTNRLIVETIANPRAGTRHTFTAYRVAGTGGPQVKLLASV